MEIPPETIINLVAGQGRIEQAVVDIGKRLDIALPALYKEHKDLETKVGKMENKQWYLSGIGTAIGAGIGYVATLFGHK